LVEKETRNRGRSGGVVHERVGDQMRDRGAASLLPTGWPEYGRLWLRRLLRSSCTKGRLGAPAPGTSGSRQGGGIRGRSNCPLAGEEVMVERGSVSARGRRRVTFDPSEDGTDADRELYRSRSGARGSGFSHPAQRLGGSRPSDMGGQPGMPTKKGASPAFCGTAVPIELHLVGSRAHAESGGSIDLPARGSLRNGPRTQFGHGAMAYAWGMGSAPVQGRIRHYHRKKLPRRADRRDADITWGGVVRSCRSPDAARPGGGPGRDRRADGPFFFFFFWTTSARVNCIVFSRSTASGRPTLKAACG